MVSLTVHFDESVLVVGSNTRKQRKQIVQTGRRKHLATKLSHKNNVVDKPVDTVATCAKVRVPNSFTPVLDGLLVRIRKDCLCDI